MSGHLQRQVAKKKGLLDLLSEASSSAPALPSKAPVYVNMVKNTSTHFDEVIAAVRSLAAAGLAPVPHLPAARFASRAELASRLRAMAGAGAADFLVVGGNDLGDRVGEENCCYKEGARSLLGQELGLWHDCGMTSVALAGHPDGHPALGCCPTATAGLLAEKVKPLLAAGLDVTVVTQFCFDARRLVQWLGRTRREMSQLEAEVSCGSELPGASEAREGCGRVRFRIGIPGPTSRKKLEKIASICEVPSMFVASAFVTLDADGDGHVSLEQLEGSADALGLARKGSKLRSMYARHAGDGGLLGQEEFCELLADDALALQTPRAPVLPPAMDSDRSPGSPMAPGPSKFVGAEGEGDGAEIIEPQELILALAAFCERERVPRGEVALHFFPFGGLPRTLQLTASLRKGTWPLLTNEELE